MSLENTVKQWLTRDEQLEFLLEERYWSNRKCLAITSNKAILFRVGMLRRIREVSDIQWRQLVDTRVQEHFRSADLTISFFPHADCLVYHDPHEEGNHDPKYDTWRLSYLRRREAKEAYRLLKEKEHVWKEKLRKEHLEHDQAIGSINSRYFQTKKPEEIQLPYTPNPPTKH